MQTAATLDWPVEAIRSREKDETERIPDDIEQQSMRGEQPGKIEFEGLSTVREKCNVDL